MSNVLEALQDDFKLFLQALWTQLDLPRLPVHNLRLRTTCNTVQSVYRSKLSEESVNRGLLERLCCGSCSTTPKRRS